MKSIKKFEKKAVKGINETKVKGGFIQRTGKFGRGDSDFYVETENISRVFYVW